MEGKVALVTGGSRGIGKAIALELAKSGATVVINYNGSRDKAMDLKQEIGGRGGRAEIYQCNVSDFAKCEELVHGIVKQYGSLDIDRKSVV